MQSLCLFIFFSKKTIAQAIRLHILYFLTQNGQPSSDSTCTLCLYLCSSFFNSYSDCHQDSMGPRNFHVYTTEPGFLHPSILPWSKSQNTIIKQHMPISSQEGICQLFMHSDWMQTLLKSVLLVLEHYLIYYIINITEFNIWIKSIKQKISPSLSSDHPLASDYTNWQCSMQAYSMLYTIALALAHITAAKHCGWQFYHFIYNFWLWHWYILYFPLATVRDLHCCH